MCGMLSMLSYGAKVWDGANVPVSWCLRACCAISAKTASFACFWQSVSQLTVTAWRRSARRRPRGTRWRWCTRRRPPRGRPGLPLCGCPSTPGTTPAGRSPRLACRPRSSPSCCRRRRSTSDGEGVKVDEKLEMKSIFKSSDRKNKAAKRGCCSCHNYGPELSVMADELQFA